MNGFSRYIHKPSLLLCCVLLLGTGTGGLPPVVAGGLVPSVQLPPDEFSLVVLALGAWKGDFHIDDQGRGGLAALHSYAENRRRLLKARGGALLLLQTGNLTGTRSSTAFAGKLLPPRVNLPRYLRFDALSLSPRENRLLFALRKRPGLRHFPGISFNMKKKAGRGKKMDFTGMLLRPRPLTPYRILTRGRRNVFITSLTPGPSSAYDQAPLKRLRREIMRQSGADLYVLMLQAPEPVESHALSARKKSGHGAMNAPGGYFHSAAPTGTNTSMSTSTAAKNMGKPGDIMDVKRIRNPYQVLNTFLPPAHTLILKSGAPKNRFHRLVNGTYLCELKGRTLCEISFRFRDRRIIGVQGRFIQLNGSGQAGPWIAPDTLLMDVLNKAPRAGK